jgi:acetyl-CoA synthetase
MTRDLSRLLRPRSILVIGGGFWCRQIVRQSRAMGFAGDIWRVHPKGDTVEGVQAFTRLEDVPAPPDAVFIGVNRQLTIETVSALSKMGAGGAVCFASGFSEAYAEDADATTLQGALVQAAGDMPILGPNCYGFINALDSALLWPDQHGCKRVERGVAILTQSSNIAINLTMQKRALPVAFVVTCGNMAQTSQAEIAMALLDDPRITAIGLHIEGFGPTGPWHALARKAAAKGVPLVALKVGASEQAQRATLSHTASLAGSDAGAEALLRYLAIPRLRDLPSFLETLKLLHCNGKLANNQMSSISCSGGEASLAADTALGRNVTFPPLTQAQKTALAQALGPMVALSNPLDYHTYVWGNAEKMTAAWLPMAAEHIGLLLIIVDYPHTDATDWRSATAAALAVRAASGRPVAVVATLPELMPEDVAMELLAGGVTPMQGLSEAILAAEAAAAPSLVPEEPPVPPGADRAGVMLEEAEAKEFLARYGMALPKSVVGGAAQIEQLAGALEGRLALKAQGFAHKSEAGALALGLDPSDLAPAAATMPGERFLVEEMVTGCLAELLIGVTRDPAHGFLMTVAAGGILTEVIEDRVSLMLPASRDDIEAALNRLRYHKVLAGFRGKPAVRMEAVLDAVMALQSCVIAHADRISEAEINPLMCTADAAIAADALILLAPE